MRELKERKLDKAIDDLSRLMTQAAAAENFVLAGQFREQMQELKERKLRHQQIAELEVQMKEAAAKLDYVTAGSLQARIQSLKTTELEVQMKEAASKLDYVTAGSLQAQVQSLKNQTATVAPKLPVSTAQGSQVPQASAPVPQDSANSNQWNNLFTPPVLQDSTNGNQWDDGFSNGMEDDELEESDDDSYAAPNQKKKKDWGTGHRLNEAITPPAAATASTSASLPQEPLRLPIKDARRLRIRLPNSSIVEEAFDSAEKLKTVYQVVQQHLAKAKVDIDAQPSRARVLQSRGVADTRGNQKVGLLGGAFAAPLSEFGFTMLATHPKREYSLEMDGTRSLADLGVARFATLTVMRCHERGVAKRADLEDKLAGAQGDAMDLDDLNYEALQELGEKIG